LLCQLLLADEEVQLTVFNIELDFVSGANEADRAAHGPSFLRTLSVA